MSDHIAEASDEQQTAQEVRLQEIENKELGKPLYRGNLNLIQNLKIKIEVTAGSAEVSVSELFALKENAVLKLDRLTTEPLDIQLDGKLVARGKLVVVGDHFGICITDIAQAPTS